MTPAEEAALAYCQQYDEFQTLFAKHRLTGWTGQLEESPPEISEAHGKMLGYLWDLRRALMMEAQPNYVDRARERLG